MENNQKSLVHKTFEVGILLKGINGVLETIGGILLLFIHPQTINHMVATITENELSQDPHDLIANFLVKSAHDLSVGGQIFGALFLLSHGIIKLFLIIALYKRKLWAYPLAMIIFGLFIVYQMYRYFLSPSYWMIILSILDVFIIVLTYLEYKNLKSRGND
jgi:uncharacterized membrane protein